MFGQFSSEFTGRKTKAAMVASAKLRNPGSDIIDARKLANNTLQYTKVSKGKPPVRVIALHDTDILTFTKDCTIVSTGGYNTVTTRARINEFAPGIRCHTKQGILHVNGVQVLKAATVNRDGSVTSDLQPGGMEAKKAQLERFMKEWRAKGLPTADKSTGDPWIFSKSQVTEDVMLDWIKSRYVFRRFYALALQFAGMPPVGVGLHLHMADTKGGKLDRLDLSRIRRYARRHIGLA